MQSLAQEQQERAIGVILSGTASDGTLGLEAIKAEGGITFGQDESAKYDSMPRNAVAAGCADLVLPPEGIARELTRIAKHPHVTGGGLAPTGESRAEGGTPEAGPAGGDAERGGLEVGLDDGSRRVASGGFCCCCATIAGSISRCTSPTRCSGALPGGWC